MTAIAHHPHPVTRVLDGVRGQLSSVAGTPVWSMDPTETTAAIAELQAAEAQLAELKARLLAHAERTEIAAQTGATSTANWHAHTTRTTRVAAHRVMRLAEGLEDHDPTRTALATGQIHAEQAEAILRALTDLPEDLDQEMVEKAERQLLDLAASFDAKPSNTSAGTSSTSSPPTQPTPTKPPCSSARNATLPPRPG